MKHGRSLLVRSGQRRKKIKDKVTESSKFVNINISIETNVKVKAIQQKKIILLVQQF
jgi:hypothetical protein